ncbi:sugar ABC transporter permease [Pseudoclavibacter sp. RFBJ3]|uniref:carbohydrate ABC transporter permease n=1 Tax=unclassified Pseudoclavibacter TaxID=2615177 RepID=UPI000CE892E8|nr:MULTISPECIES: carbohydrate ABC transporter permease [unclassified Pseudoclavibacter]MBF4552424.1 carbohydrate ABC transporter permease [Pseudoclavibacter sp. VKM Ac-2888]PPF82658.1 sugar ABC transporter permease [Pseudoclavibacter sp. RFBJ5]PPF91552.1 sugar ABC transporter permease [Pseudoclavibacter sp. RFBJ3]PPF96475.1 sugar ABC transporter permease [Pseudoclavibacter sp. RFBH5]PPG04864.1 sugar ABC transporter permease [Pseudoclavibacter sp. RFBI5]
MTATRVLTPATSPVEPQPAPIPGPRRSRSPRPPRVRVQRTLLTVTVVLIVLAQVYPLAWLFVTSFRTAADFAGGNPFALPAEFTLENYSRAFATGNLWLNIANSFIVTLGSSALIVIAGMMAAFALQVLGFRLSGLVRGLFLLGIIVPVQIALVPLFIDYSQIGLLDTHLSMIIPLAAFAMPMAVYLFSSFYEYIPREMYEAASLDGAGPYRIFTQITFPLSVNTIITVVLVNSIFIWNDFIFANTFVLSDGLKTIPLGLQNYIGAMGNTDWTATFAAVCVTVTPLLLVFLVLNKAMISGLESGATKG